MNRQILQLASFRSRVFWTLIPAVLILFLLLGIADFTQHRHLTEAEFTTRAGTIAANLAETSRVAVLTGDTQLLQNLMTSITSATDFAHARVYGENWRPLFSKASSSLKLDSLNEALTEEQKRILQSRSPLLLDELRTASGERILQLIAPITFTTTDGAYELQTAPRNQNEPTADNSKQRVIGAVLLGLSLKEVDAHMASLLQWRIILIGIFLALSATAIHYLSGRITAPIQLLTAQVNKIARGDLEQTIPVTSKDEVGILAASFNNMAHSLKTVYADLEHKVEERTGQLSAANQKLAEASEHKSQFLANANHELRTPASAVINYAQLLLSDTEGQLTALQRENLEDLLRNAQRQLRLIDSLLDFAKIEAGKVEVHTEPVQIDAMVLAAASFVEPMLNGSSVRLVREIPDHMPPVLTDREKVRRIILNLLMNAVKFTEEGEIKVSAMQQNGHFKVSVADTGIGIDPADRTRIFQEFDRGRWSNNGHYPGSGLGLAIVKSLVNVLGGSIDVDSELGKGSTFTVTLPAKGDASTRSS